MDTENNEQNPHKERFARSKRRVYCVMSDFFYELGINPIEVLLCHVKMSSMHVYDFSQIQFTIFLLTKIVQV